jgi:hypothetical protein
MRMSAEELGDNLAQLVWESFSDFLERRGVPDGDDEDSGGVLTLPTIEPEEALIFFMWLHTRSCQQACGAADPTLGKQVLDAMHRAVYEDLEAASVRRLQLPLFEQRVSARYSEYYDAAAQNSAEKVVEVAAKHVLVNELERPGIVLDLAEATTVTSGPLRDFLTDIELDGESK